MSQRQWIDITIPLREGMIVWHDDPAVRVRRVTEVANGDASTLTALAFASHTGTHIDAPAHLLAGGATVDALPIDACVGPARVIRIGDPRGVTAEELRAHRIRRGERIILRTRNSESPWYEAPFRTDYAALTPDAARHLARRGVRMVGLDALSVDPYEDAALPAHRALLGAGVWIVEGLNLCEVTAGRYDLVCLPLRIAGADGSPVRAALRPRREPLAPSTD